MTPEYFEAIARIDYCYYALTQINFSLNNRKPIDKMIDKATGYDTKTAKDCIDLVKEIINSKKEINEDYSKDQEMLNQLVEVYG